VGSGEPVRVRREVSTEAKRRIDLVLESPALILGIENKPWAAQQQDQLQDYLAELKRWAGRKRALLVFLSDQEPQSAREEVVCVPYTSDEGPSLTGILSDSLVDIRAARARVHVEEFIAFIDQHFGGSGVIDPADEPYVQAVGVEFESPLHRKAVAAVLLAHDRLHRRILEQLGRHILETLGVGFEVEGPTSLPDALSEKRSPWLIRRRSWPANLALCLEADKADFASVYFGVRAQDPKNTHIKEEGAACAARPAIERAVRKVVGGSKTSWWPWWSHSSTRHWGPEFSAKLILHSPSGQVCDHPEIVELAERLVTLGECIDQALSKSGGE
jgi:hypothetical protein